MALRAGQVMEGVSGCPKSDRTRWGNRGAKVPVARTKGSVRCARSSRGRRVLILVLVRAFQGRGPVSGFLHLAGQRELGSLNGYVVGKLAGSLAAAVQMGEGVHASVTAANLLLCARSSPMGGRADSTTSMLTGVEEKQFVTQRCTLCQKTSSFWIIAPFGEKRSAP